MILHCDNRLQAQIEVRVLGVKIIKKPLNPISFVDIEFNGFHV
nr:MAG TPA: hypothetical protein [Caudoviricetes sp.]